MENWLQKGKLMQDLAGHPSSGIIKTLNSNNWNLSAAAEEIGVPRSTLWNWVRRNDLEPGNALVKDRPADVREIRENDRRIDQLKQQLKTEVLRRKAAEEDLVAAQQASSVLSGLAEAKQYKIKNKSHKVKGGCSAIVCVTDWHLEKNIESSTVSGMNSFDLDMAGSRINKLWQKAGLLINTWSNIAKIEEVVLWFGGDLVNNYLHEEDVEGNFLGPTEAILEVESHLASGINYLVTNGFPVTRVVCNYGNHARTTRRCRPATGWKTSWEYLAYAHLESQFPELQWNVARGYFNYVDIQGKVIRFHHGEAVNYNGGVGGLTIPMHKAIAAWDESKRADLTINGHFHQYIDTWNWVSCGCLCGYDAFAQFIKAKYQPPTQTIVFVDENRGKVCSLPIFVE